MKFFNTAGPVNSEDHYCVPLSMRLDEQELYQLIEQKKYFILHAPRQTGKTSAMKNLIKQLNREGTYTAFYLDVQVAQPCWENVDQALAVILQVLKNQAMMYFAPEDPIFNVFEYVETEQVPTSSLLSTFLNRWSMQNARPIVLFIDEIDLLVGETLLSVLRQLKSGYDNRPGAFPQSICLMGVRDIRDYHLWSKRGQQMILEGSDFNIEAELLCFDNFTKAQVRDLYLQHTIETGQKFDEDAINYAFEMTQGQPWLVNALAYEACFKIVKNWSEPITKETIERAKEILITDRDIHLWLLVNRLKNVEFRKVIDAALGVTPMTPLCERAMREAVYCGLVKIDAQSIKITNPIYKEMVTQYR